MKKSSVLMILSAILVIAGIALCVIGAVNGVTGLISITPDGIRFTDEAFQKSFEEFIGNVGASSDETSGLTISANSYERDFSVIEVNAVDATICLQRSEDESYHIDYAYYASSPISVTESGNTLRIEQKTPGFFSWFTLSGYGSTYITISVPHTQLLDRVAFNTVSGDIRISKSHAAYVNQFQINTTSGDIYTDVLQTDQVVLQSVSGTIKAEIHAKNITLHTTSGEIIGNCVGDEINLSTVSGDIRMDGLSFQSTVITSVSGNLILTVADSPESVRLQFETVSGEQNIAVDPSIMNGTHMLDIETVSGALDLRFEP